MTRESMARAARRCYRVAVLAAKASGVQAAWLSCVGECKTGGFQQELCASVRVALDEDDFCAYEEANNALACENHPLTGWAYP